ncbi:hypothetical protein ACNJX9_21450 [Bradyrhizobium sp. DASA03076]|uniref:hypothetical protein n=1 Tax=Bradyrhizobium sp. BLXBL-03 TaxID=3395916 RepID=UPI003F71EEEF
MLLEDNWTCSAEKLRASQRENRLTGGPIAATPVHAFALKTRMRKRRSRSLATISASVVETTSTKEAADPVSRRESLNAKYQRLLAGIPDSADVDLGLVRLPANALIFPALPDPGEPLDLSKPRNPRNLSKEFARRAELIGFGGIRFQGFRGIHSTALLDGNIPVHRVAERAHR